ncbi:MAG TPA: hypothetical protein PL045_00220 [Chitinophagaceae bacterium]|nr:hypothetical protein [Chitinophagaceae bacterium]
MLNKDQNLEECDATGDAMKYRSLANKIQTQLNNQPNDKPETINFKPYLCAS